MGEDERVISQLGARADRLIGELDHANELILAALPGVLDAARHCDAATRHYAQVSARGAERQVLLDLAARTGRRQVIFAQASEVASHQAASEAELYAINMALRDVYLAIGAGKMAEIGLSAYSYAKRFKEFVDARKLVVDGVKVAQPVIAAGLSAREGTSGAVTTGGAVLVASQAIALVLRVQGDLKDAGKVLWDLLGTIRRVRSATELGAILSAMAHVLKQMADAAGLLVKYSENQPDHSKSGLDKIFAGLGTAVGMARDLIDAIRAFIEAYNMQQAMNVNLVRMEEEMAKMSRYTGSEEAALSALPVLQGFDPTKIEAAALATHTFNEARVLTDAARQEAQRIKAGIESATSLLNDQARLYRQSLRSIAATMSAMDELLTRARYQLLDLSFVADSGGVRGQAGKKIADRLRAVRDKVEGPLAQLKMLATIAPAQ